MGPTTALSVTAEPTKAGKRARSPSMLTSSSSSSSSSLLLPSHRAMAMAILAAFSIASSSSSISSSSHQSFTAEAAFVGPSSTKAKIRTSSSYTRINQSSQDDDSTKSIFDIFKDPPTQSINQNTNIPPKLKAASNNNINSNSNSKSILEKNVATLFTTIGISLSFLTNPLLPHLPFSPALSAANAEDELYAKYGGKGLDTSLVDKNCLLDHCSLQAKACLQDDTDCRKGLTCTAKCLGDNACITGCFARYGTPNLDNLLKCTIEDHECIKVAILEGGADKFGEEPRPPAPTVPKFDLASMEGTWYKVAGFNPNYDCYACQRNTFSAPEGGLLSNALNGNNHGNANGGLQLPAAGGSLWNGWGADRLEMDVEFSMPRLLPDGSPPPPSGVRESNVEGGSGLQSVGYNAYSTHETMVFDSASTSASGIVNDVGNAWDTLVLGKEGSGKEQVYSRTAHSEGEMFGLKFWENWYVIGQNDPGQDEFKFIYYNGKTRQNTYDGAFIYSRTRNLSPASMEKVYQIAKDAGMNPDQFCKIQNSCFDESSNSNEDIMGPREREGLGSPSNPFRGILASTKVSQFLGVESVAAESSIPRSTISKEFLQGPSSLAGGDNAMERPWWKEVGDYLEDPRRHFRLMDSLRVDMDWPEYIKQRN